MCEAIRAWTRLRLGKAAGRSRSEKHHRERTGSHDGLDKGVGLHSAQRLEARRHGKQLPHHRTRGGVPRGPPLPAHPEATARPTGRRNLETTNTALRLLPQSFQSHRNWFPFRTNFMKGLRKLHSDAQGAMPSVRSLNRLF